MKWVVAVVIVTLALVQRGSSGSAEEAIASMISSTSTGFITISDSIDQVLKEVLMSFKDIMKQGDKDLGIPILDPYVVKESFDINKPSFKLKGDFEAEIHNLSNYVVEGLHADMDLNALVNLTLNDVSVVGSYKLDGNYMNIIPIMGGGLHYLNFTSFNVALKPKFEAKDGYLRMTESGLAFREKDFKMTIEGLLEGADVSQVLAYFLKDLVAAVLSRNVQLAKIVDGKLVSSFNGKDGNGKDIYDIIETVKMLATY